MMRRLVRLVAVILLVVLPALGLAASSLPFGPPVTQYNVGRALWPLSSTESSNGITWAQIKPYYPPGNILRYGADPTGAADSASACSLAVTALSGTNGGTIYFPAGIYHISTCTISKQATVYGDGVGATQIYAHDANSNVFVVTTSSVYFHDFTVLASVTRTGGRYIYYQSTSSIGHVYNLYMSGWWIGIDLEGTSYNLHDIEMRNGVASNGNGIAVGLDGGAGNLSDISVVNVKIDNPAGSKPFSCIQLQKSGDITLIDDQLQHCGFGLAVQPGGTNVVSSLLAVNTFFDNSGTDGVILQPGAAGASIVRVRFNGCWFSSAGSYGALVDTSANSGTIDGVTFVDPEVLLNGASGISLAGTGTTRVKVIGGKIAGNTSSGVLVNANVTQFDIHDATVGPTGAVGANNVGINILTGSSNNFSVIGNDVRGNTSAAIQNAGTGTTCRISDNLGYNPRGQTSITVTASPFSFTNTNCDPILVSVAGGTVSQITVNGVNFGTATNTSVVVPPGLVVQVTYTVAPTMVYFGL